MSPQMRDTHRKIDWRSSGKQKSQLLQLATLIGEFLSAMFCFSLNGRWTRKVNGVFLGLVKKRAERFGVMSS